MIIEGVVTSLNEQNGINVAPMGPIVDESMDSLTLRPFRSSTTYRNLKQRPYGVFHVVDDVLLIARAALDGLENDPATFAATRIDGRVLSDCCRWYEFEITRFEDATDRTSLTAQVVNVGRVRDFFGFNRAKHAVLEATILATRLHLVSEDEIREQLAALSIPVEKTAGPNERAAYQFVCDFVEGWYRVHPKIRDN